MRYEKCRDREKNLLYHIFIYIFCFIKCKYTYNINILNKYYTHTTIFWCLENNRKKFYLYRCL